MQVLVTISDMKRLALAVDLISDRVDAIPVRPEFNDFTIKGRPPCRPFGITWTTTELFIANNRQLLVFDSRLEYSKTLSHSLQINTHQLAFHGGRVWVVSPSTNSLIGVSLDSSAGDIELKLLENTSLDSSAGDTELKLLENTVVPYVPRAASLDEDLVHFNSLLWANDRLYVAAHAFGAQSFITSYDQNTLVLQSLRQEVGKSIHGLAMHGGELFWLSTGASEVRSSGGHVWPISRQGYARGFAVTDDYFVVAVSQFLSRKARWGGDSWIQLINRKSAIVEKEIHLRDTGSINDLRVLDVYDYAHQLQPFGRVCRDAASDD